MNEWLHNLPVWWMALVVFAGTYLAAGGIFAIIMALAKGERVRTFKSVSSGLLSPLGTIFGLLVVLGEPGFKRTGRLEAKLALEIVTQVAAGLGAVHEQNLVHRDIKSTNIMVRLKEEEL